MIGAIILTSCEEGNIPEELKCKSDEDCVAATCCHPKACVNRGFKPDCEGIMCSMECAPGTMDCGQGRCACVNNKCTAEITE